MRGNKPFSKTAPLYDGIYTNKRYAHEAHIINKVLRSYGFRGKTMLDIGCGTGKHCIEFARLGYIPTGIDSSRQMLTVAKQNMKAAGQSFTLVRSDFAQYMPRKQFDAAVSLFHVLSYQLTNDAVMKYFQAARNCVKPKGLFVFDCWYGPGVFYHKPLRRTKRYTFNGTTLTRLKQPVWDMHNNLVHVHHTIKKASSPKTLIRELHSMRYFFIPELLYILSASGFRLLRWGKLASPLAPVGKIPPWDIWVVVQRI